MLVNSLLECELYGIWWRTKLTSVSTPFILYLLDGDILIYPARPLFHVPIFIYYYPSYYLIWGNNLGYCYSLTWASDLNHMDLHPKFSQVLKFNKSVLFVWGFENCDQNTWQTHLKVELFVLYYDYNTWSPGSIKLGLKRG